MHLQNFAVSGAPPTAYYIPNFITPEEESQIMKNVYAAPKPKWTCLSNRRLQDYGGVPHEKGMIPDKMPDWLQTHLDSISQLNLFDGKKPNQVLVNEYLPSQGIMPHTDGPLFYPTVTTITCGSHAVLSFLENNEARKKACDILLERCSLVIFQDDLYCKYLHSISETGCDIITDDCVNLKNCSGEYFIGQGIERGTRISLTIRRVPKVLRIKLCNR